MLIDWVTEPHKKNRKNVKNIIKYLPIKPNYHDISFISVVSILKQKKAWLKKFPLVATMDCID